MLDIVLSLVLTFPGNPKKTTSLVNIKSATGESEWHFTHYALEDITDRTNILFDKDWDTGFLCLNWGRNPRVIAEIRPSKVQYINILTSDILTLFPCFINCLCLL